MVVSMFFDEEWMKTEKKADPNFEGSIFQELGHDAELCPTCGAHLHGGICLNACHLSEAMRRKFNEEVHRHWRWFRGTLQRQNHWR